MIFASATKSGLVGDALWVLRSATVAVLFAGALSGVASAGTIYVDGVGGDDAWNGRCATWDGGVCGPKRTIQAGINASAAGDEVIVADGAYTGPGNRSLDPGGKAITVRSAGDNPSACVIDCENSERGFYFHTAETSATVIRGFTIRGGNPSFSGPGGYRGGGVYCEASSPRLINCVLTANQRSGIHSIDSGFELVDCTISYNRGSDGGGLFCDGGSPSLVNCVLTHNDNGGAFCQRCNCSFRNCTFYANFSSIGAALMAIDGSDVDLRNCSMYGNVADSYGGAINMTRAGAGALTVTLHSCLLWANIPDEAYVWEGALVMSYCDVQGGWAGTGNLDVDPCLTPDGHLRADSPCRDAGDPSGAPTEPDRDGEARVVAGRVDIGSDEFLDSDGDELPDFWEWLQFGSAVAADPAGDEDGDDWTNLAEYARGTDPHVALCTYYVDPGGNDAWDGLAPVWDGTHGPKATIQAALAAAHWYDEVILADGTYAGVGNRDLDFGGKPVRLHSASGDPGACVLDCQGAGRGFYFHGGETADAVVRGLTITNGSDWCGGAIWCDYHSSPTFANCAITRNVATSSSGGGLESEAWSGPKLINCALTANTAALGGGAIAGSNATLINCLICGNCAQRGGGVQGNYHTLVNCTITGNRAGSGGGLYGSYVDGLVLRNTVVWGNAPDDVYFEHGEYGEPVLTYCVVPGNWPGEGNLAIDPLLTPDGHLQANSPCRDAGDPGGDYAGQSDLDGDPRVLEERVDIGADEFLDCDADALPDWWEALYFNGPTAGMPDGDEDGDGWSDLEEYARGADPFRELRTYYASTDGEDYWDGRAAEWDGAHGPKATIQAALDAAISYDEVIVADGTYSGPGNRDLDLRGKRLTLRSASGDPALCTIDCQRAGRGIYFHSMEWPDTVVSGFTITNGLAERGAGVDCELTSSPTLTRCIIRGNEAAGTSYARGGGVSGSSSCMTLLHCAIDDNTGHWVVEGAGCSFDNLGRVTLVDCSLTGNYLGGGIRSHGTDLYLENCTIADNTGRGVRVEYGARLTLIGCTIQGNGGGVFYETNASLVMRRCIVTGNSCGDEGGGIYCLYDATFDHCIIANNSPSGVYHGGGDLLMTDCTISGNHGGEAGGIMTDSGTLVRCTLEENDGWHGGGVYCRDGDSLVLEACIISGNSGETGAGVECESGSSPTLRDCLVVDNVASEYGGGVYACGSTLTLTGCTIAYNSAPSGPQLALNCREPDQPHSTFTGQSSILWGTASPIWNSDGSTVSITYSDVFGGWSGAGNKSVNPLFADSAGSDYHLTVGSPCIDAGLPDYVPPAGASDIDGELRLWDGNGDGVARVDMGADEYGSAVAGDVNCDGSINVFDIDPFVVALTDPVGYQAAFPACNWRTADVDGNGTVDVFDIDPFVRLLTGG